jgi:GT2 family glycosyltransferase
VSHPPRAHRAVSAATGRFAAEPVPQPEVSIVTIGHSVRRELLSCLQSIERYAELPVETIFVDNASTDGTVEWLRREHPEATVLELGQNVWGSARNHGLARARGRYTMFIDSDARLTEGALPAMVEALDQHPSWGMIGPRLIYPDGTLQHSCRRFPPALIPLMRRPPLSFFLEESSGVRRHLMEDMDHEHPRPVLYMIGACLLFRTRLARKVGDLDIEIGWGGCEDVDWCIRWWDAGEKVIYFPGATVIHDYRRTSNRSPLSAGAWRHLNSFLRLQWKYRDRRAELARLTEELDRSLDR